MTRCNALQYGLGLWKYHILLIMFLFFLFLHSVESSSTLQIFPESSGRYRNVPGSTRIFRIQQEPSGLWWSFAGFTIHLQILLVVSLGVLDQSYLFLECSNVVYKQEMRSPSFLFLVHREAIACGKGILPMARLELMTSQQRTIILAN